MSNSGRSIDRLRRAAGCLILLALAASGLSGCAAQPPPRPQWLVQSAARVLANREQSLNSLQTAAIMEYSGPAGHLKAREQLTARRPASLRIEALSPLGVALVVAADGAQIAIYNRASNTLMRGAATAATFARFTRIPLAPAQAVQLLLALVPDSSLLTATPSAHWTEGRLRVFAYGNRGVSSYEIGFDGSELALVRSSDASGQPLYEVHYKAYRDIGALTLPFEIEGQFFASATTIKLHYLDPLVDGQIADSMFVLSPGPHTKLIKLSDITESQAPIV